MSTKLIALMHKQAEEASAKAQALNDLQADGTTLTDAQEAELKAALGDEEKFGARLRELIEQETRREAARKAHAAFQSARPETLDPEADEQLADPARVYTRERTVSLGAAYVTSDAFKHYMLGAKGHSGGEFDFDGPQKFATITSEDANGRPIAGFWKAADAGMPARRTPLLDACGSEQSESGHIWWVEWPITAPTANIVAEGAQAPEATYKPLVRNAELDKVVAQVPITEEFLDDNTRMRSVIDGALTDGVRQKAESEASATLVATALPTSPGTGTLLEEIRRGVGYVVNAGFDAATVVVNPMDYAELDIDLLSKTLQGAKAYNPLWGLNVVPAGAVPIGTAFVGDFLAGARVFWKASVKVSMTTSHEDEFTSGILRVKAVQRIKTVIIRPEAIVKCAAAVTP